MFLRNNSHHQTRRTSGEMAMDFARVCAAVTPDKMAARLCDVAANCRSVASKLTSSRQGTAAMAIKKALISGAIVVGSCIVGAAPAGADTSLGDDPNPFGSLGCSCQDTTPPDNPALMQEKLQRGIEAALSASPPRPVAQ
jgi:hypothetical protein